MSAYNSPMGVASRPILISPNNASRELDPRLVASWAGHTRHADVDQPHVPNAPVIGSMTVPSRLKSSLPILELPSPASVSDDTISLVLRGETTNRFAASAPMHMKYKYIPKAASLGAPRQSALSILESEDFRENISASLDGDSGLLLKQQRSRASQGAATDDRSSGAFAVHDAAVRKAPHVDDEAHSRRPTFDEDDGLFALES